jgi:hypothetical protein
MVGDKGKDIALSPGRSMSQVGSEGADERAEADALGAVLSAAEHALDTGDAERAKRLIGVAKEMRALGFGRGE